MPPSFQELENAIFGVARRSSSLISLPVIQENLIRVLQGRIQEGRLPSFIFRGAGTGSLDRILSSGAMSRPGNLFFSQNPSFAEKFGPILFRTRLKEVLRGLGEQDLKSLLEFSSGDVSHPGEVVVRQGDIPKEKLQVRTFTKKGNPRFSSLAKAKKIGRFSPILLLLLLIRQLTGDDGSDL